MSLQFRPASQSVSFGKVASVTREKSEADSLKKIEQNLKRRGMEISVIENAPLPVFTRGSVAVITKKGERVLPQLAGLGRDIKEATVDVLRQFEKLGKKKK